MLVISLCLVWKTVHGTTQRQPVIPWGSFVWQRYCCHAPGTLVLELGGRPGVSGVDRGRENFFPGPATMESPRPSSKRSNATMLVSILPDAATVIALLPAWFEDYNEVHPHSGLKFLSAREFLRLSALRNQAACPVKRGAHQARVTSDLQATSRRACQNDDAAIP
jgi:hypothetical protein